MIKIKKDSQIFGGSFLLTSMHRKYMLYINASQMYAHINAPQMYAHINASQMYAHINASHQCEHNVKLGVGDCGYLR